jgi:transketolase
MRKNFASLLHEAMSSNDDIYLITGDLGYGLWDRIRDDFPKRFYNVGSSEMAMMGMGIGLAMEGKIPFVYSITPFAIYRPFEMIRNYLDHESIPVTIVGGGRDRDYGYLGFSHWADDDRALLSGFQNLQMLHPESEDQLKTMFGQILSQRNPYYLNLRK